jgi:starch-binding outer membrane protein, SusD/RagB family
MKYIHTIIIACSLLLILMGQMGCRRLVEPDASTEKIGVENVYANDKTAASVLTRLFANMGFMSEGWNGYPLILAMYADELKLGAAVTTGTQNIYFNSLPNDPTTWWTEGYKHIYTSNDAIEQLTASTGVSPTVKNLLLGEARFARAFVYFNLINTYGDVPLTLTTDYRVNMNLGRAPIADIYQQIVGDLLEAKALLSDQYLGANMLPGTAVDRVRPNKTAATALLARVYLYIGEYAKAEAEASEVINNPLYGFIELNNVFLKNSKEAIWQLPPFQTNINSGDAMVFVLRRESGAPNGPTSSYPFLASDYLMNAFETGDLRKTKWIGDSSGYKFINKYKNYQTGVPVTEAIMMLRLGEQYLIRAEARINQDKISEGIDDLNTLRKRARGSNPGDLPDLSKSLSKTDALKAVSHERQVELFTEWGHRWFDLKRTKKIDEVMKIVTPVKSNNTVQWESFRALFPILIGEINGSPGMTGHQNPGYPG